MLELLAGSEGDESFVDMYRDRNIIDKRIFL